MVVAAGSWSADTRAYRLRVSEIVGKISDMDNSDKDLEQVLRETPWSALLLPLILGIVVAVVSIVIVVFS